VPRNDEYCILKSFAILEETPGVPGLDIPGFDIVSIAKGYGCHAERLNDLDAIKKAAVEAWNNPNPRCWRFRYLRKYRHSSSEEHARFESRAIATRSQNKRFANLPLVELMDNAQAGN